MRSVTYSMGVSLDGFIVGPDGGFDWGAPDEEVFRFWIDEIREVVDGTPARLWTLTRPSAADSRHLATVSGFVDERLTLGPGEVAANRDLKLKSHALHAVVGDFDILVHTTSDPSTDR